MTDRRPFVSIVVPCRNERAFVVRCLDSILGGDYPTERLEVLVVDGMSDDGTRGLLARYAERHRAITLLDNPRRTVPAALNLGLARARGDVILRMDMHAEYPPGYVGDLVGWLQRTGADNVGGACVTCPATSSATARAIALALAHPLGIGNAWFRLGTRRPRRVDTVPFGCYRRDVFARIGTFDEELIRNQDDEFNARLIRAGGTVLLVPNVVARYYARASLRHLGRMYYQYGLFKPAVVRKLGTVPTLRQLVPPTSLVVLAAGGALAPWHASAGLVVGGLSVLYAVLVVGAAAATIRSHGWRCATALAATFPVLHASYGLGYLRGIVRELGRLGGRRRDPGMIALSR